MPPIFIFIIQPKNVEALISSFKLVNICLSVEIMGIFISCCKSTSSESGYLMPTLETKRRQQAEAAERRIKEQESRGIKDPARLKQKTQRLEELERKQEEAMKSYGNEPKLTWTVG